MERKTKPAISKLRLPFFKRLKRRGARASDITNASPDAFILFDRNLNIVGMNPVARSVFHLILGENVIGEDVPTGAPDMKHDSKNNGRYKKYLNAIRKGKPFFADSIVIHSGLLDINLKAEAFKVGKGFGIIFSDLDALKKTEKTPYDSQKGLAINLQSVPDCIFIFDLKGTILHGSRAGESLTGYAWEEIKGKSFLEIPLLAPEYLPKAAQLLELSASGKPAGPDEFELIRKDGGHVFVDISTCPIGGGEEREVVGIAHDITERKQSEEALRKSEEKYEAIVETSLDGIYQVDVSGKFTFINESFASTFGYKRDALLGRQFSSLLSAEIIPKVAGMVKEVLAGKDVRDEVPVLHKDGHEVMVNFGATPLKDCGKIVGLTGILKDVTERRRMEEELANSEARYRSFIETTSAGVATIDLKGELTLVNEALCRMIGYSQEELLGKNFADFLHPDDKENLLDIFAKGLEGGEKYPVLEFRGIHKDGHTVWCYCSPTPIVQGDEIAGFSAVIHDITERKKAEQALKGREEYFKALVENAYGVINVIRRDGMIAYRSPGSGYVPGLKTDCTDMSGLDLVHPDDVSKCMDAFAKVLEKPGAVANMELRTKYMDDSWHTVEASATNLLDNEAVQGIVVHWHDITERKRAEEVLHFTRFALDNTTDEMVCVSQDARYIDVNDAFCRSVGYSREDLLSMTVHDIDPNYSAKIWSEFWEKLKRSGSLTFESRHRTKDGKVFPVEVTVTFFEYKGKEYHCGFARDITERKQAEETLRDSEERFRSILENAPFGYYRVDKDGLWQYVSPVWERMHGFSLEEVIGKPFEITQTEDDVEQSKELVKRALAGEAIAGEFSRLRKDGGIEYHGFNIQPVKHDNEIVAIEGFINDITERKKAEEALHESEARFRNLVALAPDAIMTMDLDGIVTSWNSSAERLTGYSADEMIGKHFSDFETVPPEDAPRYLKIFESLLRGQVPETFEAAMLHKDGTHRLVDVKVGLIEKGGKYVGLQVISRDITERKKAEEALRQSEERLRRVLDNAIDMIYWVNLRTGEYDYVALSSEKVIGYTPDELIALGIAGGRSLVHPDDSERLDQNVIDLLTNAENGNAPHAIEYRFAHKKLGYRWIFDNRSIVYEGDEAVAIVGSVRDITERKQAEQALRESEEKYRLLAENVTDVIWTMDMDLRFTYISPSVTCLRGLTVKEAMAERLEDIFSPSSFQDLVKTFEEGMVAEATGLRDPSRSWTLELEENCKDGSLIWVEIRAGLLRDQDGRPVGLVGVTRDITERKQAEQALQDSEESYRELAESIGDVFFALDENLRYVYWNKASETLTGIEAKDAIGKSIHEVFGDTDQTKRSAGIYREVLATQQSQSFENEFQLGGKLYVFEIHAYPTRKGVSVFTRDKTEAKRAEEALKDSEERYRALVNTAGLAGEGIMIVERAEGNKAVIAFVNDTLSGMLGYQQGEMLGMPARDLFLPGDRIWLQDKNRRRRKGEALPSHYAVMAWRKDGSMLPIEISMGAMRYQDKSATVIYVRDVTERKQAEEALRESEAQFRAIFDRAAIGVGLVDVNGRTLRINPALQRLLGYTIEELRGMTFTDYMHPDDATVDAGLFQEMVRGKRDHYQVEKRYIRKDGQIAWGRVTLSAVRGLGGKLQFAIGMVEDITDSKRALENLRKSEERFRSLTENASEVVLIIDKEGTITYASPSVERMLGYKLEEGIGKESFSFVHPDDMPQVMGLFEQMTQNPGGTFTAKVRVQHKDGSWLVAEAIGRNLLDNPAVEGIVVNYRDVTEREQAQEELLQHTRQVEALHSVAQLASQTLELEELLSTSLDKVIEVMEAEAGCVYLLDMVEKELVLRTSRGLSDETISRLEAIKLNENNIQKILEWKGGSTPLRKIFEETGLSITAEVKEKEQIKSFAVAPFAVRGQLSGLIAVGNRAYRKFSPGDMDLLRAVGNQIGIGTQNAMLYEEVRALIRETIDAQETERERVCLEVHDGVAQTLVSAFQYLQALEATAPDDTKTKQLLAKTSAQVKLAIQESREVINSLQPATLSDLGLVSTLRHELKRLGQETGLKIDFKADAIRLPKDIETGLYRIIREAVFNARKHANTKQLRVKINSEDERVKVEVRDWGKGFDHAYLDRARKRGTGLFSIRKRAELMKGSCEIQSEPGHGTTVRVEIPVSAAERSSG